jgi:periplasmic protein TonB
MSYQALLFCPDEKTARTVTQILSELEFNVEPCVETFAAVKKLMGTHFDAVVVDCDNEQNAALLFKSARNSTSNQASLAVALVEGQAGVAKAFRIGANLVLTKPINIEQAKGTVRVARGLLRKGDTAKPGAPAQASTPVAAAPAKPAPQNPISAKPVPPAKPATPAAAATPRPSATPASKPAWPAHAAVASSGPVSPDSAPSDNDLQNNDLPEISLDDDITARAAATPAPPAIHRPPAQSTPAGSAPATSLAAAITKAKTAPKPVSPQASPATASSGAASAPAPARETPANATPAQEAKPLDIAESSATATSAATDIATEPIESSSPVTTGLPPTSFTFGGNATASESSGSSKKILLIVAAVVIVAAVAYAGWSYFQGRSNTPAIPVSRPSTQPPLTANPGQSQPTTAASTPAPTDTAPTTPSVEPTTKSVVETPSTVEAAPAAISKKPNNIAAAGKTAQPDANEKPATAPLVVKGGTVHTSKPTTEAAADAPAPSMIGIATPGAGAPPADLVSGATGPAPVLQSVNISQGVSQGLLIKKVQPIYPKAALTMHIEGAVQLGATISKTGDISSLKVLSGDPRLAAAAIEAVKQWKYKPYLLDGEPIQIQTTITLNFKAPN